MKTYIKQLVLATLIGLLGRPASAQTVAGWISQGTTALANHALVNANAAFAQAVALSPTNEPANAYYAATRVLVLSSQPAGSNFLTRLGFPVAGRNIYAWDSTLPKDTNGLLLAPAGVNAGEFTSQLRTNLLPAVAGAIGNLAAITDTNFTLNIASNQTDIASVTADYGDFKLIQAGCYAVEYLVYTLNAQNLNAQLSALRALYTQGGLSVGGLLADYPQLFTFATTNDLQNAETAFTNAINAYYLASDFIRARPPGETRLFNFDPGSDQKEADFRLVLQDLKNSLLVGPQLLSLDPNVSVDMSAQFEDPASWRSLLPKFEGNAIALGSLPDVTFGGMIDGLTEAGVEGYLAKHFTMLPVGRAPELLAGNFLNLVFTTLPGHYYVLEASTNLATWSMMTNFTAVDVTSTITSPQPAKLAKRFYRLRDDTGFLTFTGVVSDQNTGLPIAGAMIYSDWDGSSAVSGAGGGFYLATTLSSDYGGDYLQISAPGYATVDNYYRNYGGNGLVSGLNITLVTPPPNDDFANRFVLTGSTLSTNGNNFLATVENGEPDDNGQGGRGGKSVWFTWTPPASGQYLISISPANFEYPILAIYTGSQLANLSALADVVGTYYNAHQILSLTAGQACQIEVDDFYDSGGSYTLNIAPY